LSKSYLHVVYLVRSCLLRRLSHFRCISCCHCRMVSTANVLILAWLLLLRLYVLSLTNIECKLAKPLVRIMCILWTKKHPHVLFCCSFYKHWPISVKFGTQYAEGICNTILICPLHLHTVATLPWERYICGFVTILADLLRQNAVKLMSNLRIKSNRWKIFAVAYCRDVALMQEMQSPTCAIAVKLTSNSNTVCQLPVRVSQLSYCNMKLLNSLVQWSRLYDCQLAWILVLLNSEYRIWVAESCMSDASSSMADLR